MTDYTEEIEFAFGEIEYWLDDIEEMLKKHG